MKPLAHVATSRPRRIAAVALAITISMGAPVLLSNTPSGAGIVPTVPLATAAEYSVLGGSTVTNTGNSVLNESLGLSPGPDITGFPPGLVNAPGTTEETTPAAAQAQLDLTTAYNNAAGRPTETILAADLGNQALQPGVYSTSSRGALLLTGPLVLDGGGNADAVFIFQTNSSLTTASSSTVEVVNGASECNVFWQIGSSATLGSSSTMVGNVMADQSISLNDSVTVHGRALARIGGVTLINDTFTAPDCTPSTTPAPAPRPLTPTAVPAVPGGPAVPFQLPPTTAPPTTARPRTPGVPPVSGPPRTGAIPTDDAAPWQTAGLAGVFGVAGAAALGGLVLMRRRPAPVHPHDKN